MSSSGRTIAPPWCTRRRPPAAAARLKRRASSASSRWRPSRTRSTWRTAALQGAAKHSAGRRVEGKLLDSAERILTKHVLDTFRLDAKVALVTGGARGLGQTMARALAEAGADIALTGRSIGPAAEAASAIAS